MIVEIEGVLTLLLAVLGVLVSQIVIEEQQAIRVRDPTRETRHQNTEDERSDEIDDQ